MNTSPETLDEDYGENPESAAAGGAVTTGLHKTGQLVGNTISPSSSSSSSSSSTSRAMTMTTSKQEGTARGPVAPHGDEGFLQPGRGQAVWMKTFGCSHNASDSEIMLGLLQEAGYTIADAPTNADVAIVNSCTVKNPSQDAAVNLLKQQGHNKPVILTGCVSQADPKLVANLEKGKANISIVGLSYTAKIVDAVEQVLLGNRVYMMDFLQNPKKDAPALPKLMLPKVRKNPLVEIIAINTGCLGDCTYCKTKQARGDLRSYPVEQIVERAKFAWEVDNVQQVWLTSEDTGAYGIDIGTSIVVLIEALLDVAPKGKMLRLGMTNPPYMARHAKRIGELLQHENMFEFLHVPVQSGADFVLQRMNREYTRSVFMRMCDNLLKICPDMTLATDIICGFPGERDMDHVDTLELIKKYKFAVVNISQFYPRPGTKAAEMQRVDTAVVKQRSTEVTDLFLSYTRNEKWLRRGAGPNHAVGKGSNAGGEGSSLEAPTDAPVVASTKDTDPTMKPTTTASASENSSSTSPSTSSSSCASSTTSPGLLHRVWWSDTDLRRGQTIGHTKQHVKVVLSPRQDDLLGTNTLVNLKACSKWHLEADCVVPENEQVKKVVAAEDASSVADEQGTGKNTGKNTAVEETTKSEPENTKDEVTTLASSEEPDVEVVPPALEEQVEVVSAIELETAQNADASSEEDGPLAGTVFAAEIAKDDVFLSPGSELEEIMDEESPAEVPEVENQVEVSCPSSSNTVDEAGGDFQEAEPKAVAGAEETEVVALVETEAVAGAEESEVVALVETEPEVELLETQHPVELPEPELQPAEPELEQVEEARIPSSDEIEEVELEKVADATAAEAEKIEEIEVEQVLDVSPADEEEDAVNDKEHDIIEVEESDIFIEKENNEKDSPATAFELLYGGTPLSSGSSTSITPSRVFEASAVKDNTSSCYNYEEDPSSLSSSCAVAATPSSSQVETDVVSITTTTSPRRTKAPRTTAEKLFNRKKASASEKIGGTRRKKRVVGGGKKPVTSSTGTSTAGGA
ncbi:unnamed protein product [Amoebophrya sp. A25]|nr:unnamed protein product [Amoebophrya sp. A25]|eukprot:GSA25T00020770001.1